MEIKEDDLSGHEAQDLLRIHLAGMHKNSPPGHVSALDLSGLKNPFVTVWTVWEGNQICGIGALKRLDPETGEIKSMRTHPDFLHKGVGRLLLQHIVHQAQASGMRFISLETGSGAAFEPALRLYRNYGFVDGECFADYKRTEFNQFLHLTL